jgi:serine/threonine-protein kinase
VLLLTTSALAWLPLMPGRTVNRLLTGAAVGALGITALAVLALARDEKRYTPAVFRFFGYVAATVSIQLEYYFGVFSPVSLVVTLGVTFFGMGMDRRHALLIPLYAIAGYTVLASLVTAGVVEDVGVIQPVSATLNGKLFFVAMAPMVLLVSLWMARVSRRSMADALSRATDASRLAAQREALLVEAQQDLEQLIRAGAGLSGRYTGTTAGQYEVQEIIGRGAMGEVYAARDPETDERAAIKFLRPEVMVKERMLERFMREGRAAGSLASPHVVSVLDVGEVSAGRIPYIAMELLSGEDLAAVLRKRRTLPLSEAAELISHIATGLHAAHEAGIVHRDLKPQNLFRHRADAQARGTWKILDFGVSKLADSGGTLTQRAVVGTPGYMAPEQARAGHIDLRCDVFALGVVGYRVTTGRPAFGGGDLPTTLFSIVYEQPPRPSSLAETIPRDVDRVLAIALAKEPDERFQSALEFSEALQSACSGKLSSQHRERASRLLRAHPWGTTRAA